jgi:hypothetical protein
MQQGSIIIQHGPNILEEEDDDAKRKMATLGTYFSKSSSIAQRKNIVAVKKH